MLVQTRIGGYFTESEAKKIKESMTGKTFHNFKVEYSNKNGNCEISVESNYYEENDYDTEKEYQEVLEEDFMYYTVLELLKCIK